MITHSSGWPWCSTISMRAFEYDDHVVVLVAVGEQDFAVRNAMLGTVATQGRELRFSEQGAEVRVLGTRLELGAHSAGCHPTARPCSR